MAFLLTANCSSVISTTPGLNACAQKTKTKKDALTGVRNQQTEMEGEADHLDSQESIVTIIQEVLGLAAIDPNNAQEKLSAEAKSHELHFLSDDSI